MEKRSTLDSASKCPICSSSRKVCQGVHRLAYHYGSPLAVERFNPSPHPCALGSAMPHAGELLCRRLDALNKFSRGVGLSQLRWQSHSRQEI